MNIVNTAGPSRPTGRGPRRQRRRRNRNRRGRNNRRGRGRNPRPNAQMSKGKAHTMHPAVHRGVCAITDPFCPAARGTRWPDENGQPTITYQVRGSVAMVTGLTGGQCVVLMQPNFPYGFLNFPTTTAGTWDLGVNSLLKYPNVGFPETNGSQFRIVSFGAVLRNTLSATATTGQFFAWQCPKIAQSTVNNVPEYSASSLLTKAAQIGVEMSQIAIPSGPTARGFLPLNTGSSVDLGSNDWPLLVFAYTGGPAGVYTPANIEFVMNLEFFPLISTGAGALARPAVGPSPIITRAATTVNSNLGGVFDGGTTHVEKAVSTAVKTLTGSFDWESALLDGLAFLGL